jgi:hypothetical protein
VLRKLRRPENIHTSKELTFDGRRFIWSNFKESEEVEDRWEAVLGDCSINLWLLDSGKRGRFVGLSRDWLEAEKVQASPSSKGGSLERITRDISPDTEEQLSL